jgi:hypothetical protein
MSFTKYPTGITENRIQFSINASPSMAPAKNIPKEFIVEWLDSSKRTVQNVSIEQKTKDHTIKEVPANTDSIPATYKTYDNKSTSKPYILNSVHANRAIAVTFFPFSKSIDSNNFEKYYLITVTLSDGSKFEYFIYTYYYNGNPISMGDANKPIGG